MCVKTKKNRDAKRKAITGEHQKKIKDVANRINALFESRKDRVYVGTFACQNTSSEALYYIWILRLDISIFLRRKMLKNFVRLVYATQTEPSITELPLLPRSCLLGSLTDNSPVPNFRRLSGTNLNLSTKNEKLWKVPSSPP